MVLLNRHVILTMLYNFNKIRPTKRVIRYLIVGTSAFIVEFFSFTIILGFINGPYNLLITQSVSFSLGLLVSFTGSRLFTFNESKNNYANNIKKQFLYYSLLAAANLLLSNLVIAILVQSFFIIPFISKLAVMFMIVLWNYFIFNKLIFKTNK